MSLNRCAFPLPVTMASSIHGWDLRLESQKVLQLEGWGWASDLKSTAMCRTGLSTVLSNKDGKMIE